MENDYLKSTIRQLEYYKSLGERTFVQVSDEALFWEANADSNSIATIVKHLRGNMLSRWTNFLTTDGEKADRDRETEFENDIKDREEMLEKWQEGWNCCLQTIRSLKPEDLQRLITIRGQKHTVLEAINRQLSHYPYHIGQIVFLGKLLCTKGWDSLSIPKGGTAEFNASMQADADQPSK